MASEAAGFSFNQILTLEENDSITGTYNRDYYCIDESTTKLIKGCATQRSSSRWRKLEGEWKRIKPDDLWIWDVGPGWVALRENYQMDGPLLLARISHTIIA
jgi:hypothetical protein